MGENGQVFPTLPLIPQTDAVEQARTMCMEASTRKIKVNEDISFPGPHAIVMLPWLHGNPLGKRRTTLIRKRVVVFGKQEQ